MSAPARIPGGGSPRRATRAAALLAAALLAAASAAWAGPTPARDAAAGARPGWRTTHVSYLAGASVYLDAGSAAGLAAGDSVWIVRGAGRIAALRVSVLSTRRASCDTLWTKAGIAVGDAAEFRPAAPAVPPGGDGSRADSLRAAAIVAPGPARATSRAARLRGRLGVRWLGIDAAGAGRLSQPALEVRLDARDGLGGHFAAALDLRTRRTFRSSESGRWVERYSRVHRASATLRSGSGRHRLTLGRQSSPTLASVSLFDGALVEWTGTRFGAGAFAGTQPDPERSRWSPELLELGGFVEAHPAPLAAERWSVAAGAVGSRHRGELDREFLFTQGWWFSPAVTASFVQEVDVNRDWKRAAGEPAVAWTNTFAAVRVPWGARVAWNAGYDNRRNVRLWRDRETPETRFDDRYRQGTWAGATLEPNAWTSAGGEYRVGAGAERTDAWSVTGEVHALTAWRLLVRGRWAAFTDAAFASSIVSLAAGGDPMPRSHLEWSGGERRTRDRFFGSVDHEHWLGLDLDLALGTRWYASASAERIHGPAGGSTQVQTGLSVRL
jgi:hypothetical protein